MGSTKNTVTMLSLVLTISILGIASRARNDLNIKYGANNDHILFDFKQREGPSGSWNSVVIPSSPDKGRLDLKGQIYEADITNISSVHIDSWEWHFEINQDCYLNSSWNGKLEIKQNDGRKNYVSHPVDLREAKEEYLGLKTLKNTNGILLIPLKKGDSFIYHPANQEILLQKKYGNKTNSIQLGFIFYTEMNAPAISADGSIIKIHLKNSYLNDPLYYIFSVSLMTSLVLLMYTVRMKQIEAARKKEKEHDKQLIEQIMISFAKFIDAKDPCTGGHSERVAKYSKMLAKEMGLTDEECETIYHCGLLHDSGKIAIPDEILRKPDRLTADEYEIIQDHTIKGSELLSDLTSIPEAEQVAKFHHERVDGTGYPYGLKGEDIPEFAKIVAVADAFDTMHSARYYKEAQPLEAIMEQIKSCSGTQFDSTAASALLRLISKGKIK